MKAVQNQLSETLDHLFRHEYGRMVAVLCRIFGFENIQIAEDLVQESLIKAMESWRYGQIPDNPKAWLYKVAKNKALDYLRSQRIREGHVKEISVLYQSEYTLAPAMDQLFLEHEMEDSQLRMLFAVCHPEIPQESQIALALQTLSGFSVDEIARAFLSNKETISKRIYRAKERIKSLKLNMEVPVREEIPERLDTVLTCIYLMLNKSYDFALKEKQLNRDLCYETARLAKLLTEHPLTKNPKCSALLALICFQASRFDARLDEKGQIVPYEEQKPEYWNKSLINEGLHYLNAAAEGKEISPYHLEAAIASQYCLTPSPDKVNWELILHLYDLLIQLKNNPVTQMNRAVVLSKVKSEHEAIQLLEKLDGLEHYYLYHATLGDLYEKSGDKTKAKTQLEKALLLCNSEVEKAFLSDKINAL